MERHLVYRQVDGVGAHSGFPGKEIQVPAERYYMEDLAILSLITLKHARVCV